MADPTLPKFKYDEQQAVVPFFFMHEGEECVKVQIAGETRFGPVFPANGFWMRDGLEEITYAERWPEQYAQFKSGMAQVADGTALENAPFLNPSRISQLRQLKVYSIEALANMDDRNISRLEGQGYKLKALAQEFLQNRTVAKADDKVAQLERQLAELQRQLTAQPANLSIAGDLPRREWLREQIKVATGKYPAGQPSDETLERLYAELNEAA